MFVCLRDFGSRTILFLGEMIDPVVFLGRPPLPIFHYSLLYICCNECPFWIAVWWPVFCFVLRSSTIFARFMMVCSCWTLECQLWLDNQLKQLVCCQIWNSWGSWNEDWRCVVRMNWVVYWFLFVCHSWRGSSPLFCYLVCIKLHFSIIPEALIQ